GGCSYTPWADDELLVKIGNQSLYLSELSGVFSPHISEKDSIALLQNYVETWIKRRLLLKLAEKQLDAKQKDVSDLLEDYRTSLLIYRYEQSYIEQQVDTVVTNSAIQKFYQQNQPLFILSRPILKGVSIKVSKNSNRLAAIRNIYASTKSEDMLTLENFCAESSIKSEDFSNKWVTIEDLTLEMPKEHNYEVMLSSRRSFEVEDSYYVYFVVAREYLPRKSVAPMEYEYENIKSVLLNQRKKEIIEEMETRILQNAKNNNYVKVFINKQ
ncbi:MAG: hypothetical protein ACRC9X_07915, partial [Bacteroidales bacterium]